GGARARPAPSPRPPPPRPSSPSASRTGSNGNFSASGKHPPHSGTAPSAEDSRIASRTSRVLPTPASPTTSSSRASPSSAARSSDNSRSRPTKPADPATCPPHQPRPARSTPSAYRQEQPANQLRAVMAPVAVPVPTAGTPVA